MRLCKEQIVSEVQRSQLHYFLKSLFLSYNQVTKSYSHYWAHWAGRREVNPAKTIIFSWVHPLILMYHHISCHQVSWCIITIGRIEQVAGVRGSSVRVRVDVVVHNLEFCISDKDTNEKTSVQCNNFGYNNYKLRMARWTTKIPTIWRIQIAGGRCPAHPEHPFAFP